jgi:hypothetical protein
MLAGMARTDALKQVEKSACHLTIANDKTKRLHLQDSEGSKMFYKPMNQEKTNLSSSPETKHVNDFSANSWPVFTSSSSFSMNPGERSNVKKF